MTKPKCLAIELFYNDDDIVEDQILHMLANNHDIVVWDHGSNDRTSAILDSYASCFRERHHLPREFDFYKIFEHVSRYVIENLAADYDWISFPESDEFLEGPTRERSYYEWLCVIHENEAPADWIKFTNMVYWWTEKDDATIFSPRKRIKHYSPWLDCPPRVYAWRAAAMNVREFNHNPALGRKLPIDFKTCHYQFRSEAQALKRIEGRKGLRRGGANVHFDNMAEVDKLRIPASQLHFDDGGELSMQQTVDFRRLYGV